MGESGIVMSNNTERNNKKKMEAGTQILYREAGMGDVAPRRGREGQSRVRWSYQRTSPEMDTSE
jgi:hypothetical protein